MKKNLRKVLAVVLVVCMALSFTVMASATNVKDYSDASSIKQTEAVDLFTALGFLAGNNGAFNPTGNFTREMAAKLITYMLIGSAKADALKTSVSSFSDVATTRWSAPYIQYCVSAGILNGDGTGKFNPDANVSGSQFGKMLLTAIGYGKNGEYTGANWEMQAIADATSLGIFSLNVDLSAPATREQCAQYGFNAYTTCKSVVYNTTTHAYMQATNIDGVDAKGTLATQQGVDKTTFTYTLNGTAYYKWAKYGAELTGGYTKDKVLGTSYAGITIADLSDPTNAKFIASIDTGATIYLNGTAYSVLAYGATTTVGQVYYNTVAGGFKTAAGLTAAAGDLAAAPANSTIVKGTVVSFVSTDSDSKAETVQVINKTVSVLSGAALYNSGANTVTLTGTNGLTIVNLAASKVPGYASFADKDVVIWYLDNVGTYHIDKATSVSGTINSYVAGTSATLGGTSYLYSGLTGNVGSATVQTYYGLADTALYLDDGGYIAYAKQAVATNPAASFCFVTDATTAAFVTSAKLVLSDGTKSVVTLDPTSALYNTGTVTPNQFYKFSVTSAGKYVLTALTSLTPTAGIYTAAGTPDAVAEGVVADTYYQNTYTNGGNLTKITKGTVNFLSDATAPAVITERVANNSTRFVYTDTTNSLTYAFTGISSVPTFTADATAVVYTLSLGNGTNATTVFAYATGIAADFSPTTTVGDWVFIENTNRSVSVVSSTVNKYTFDALVNGEHKTISTTSSTLLNAVGLYLVTGYDSDGNVTIASAANAVTGNLVQYVGAATGANIVVSGGTIKIDAGTYWLLNSGVKFYRIDTTNTVAGKPSTYQLSAEQVDVLPGPYAVDLVRVSSSDTSIVAVYIYGA